MAKNASKDTCETVLFQPPRSVFWVKNRSMLRSCAIRRDAELSMLCLALVAALSASLVYSAQMPPEPAYTIDATPLTMGGATGSGSLTFISDHILAVGFCFKDECSIGTVDLSGPEPHSLSNVRMVDRFRQIKRARDGGVLLSGITRHAVRDCLHFDPNLRTPLGTSGTTQGLEKCDELPAGSGHLVATSDRAVAFLEHGVIRIESMQSKILGTFRVKIPDNEVPTVHLLGNDRILIQRNGRPEIRDYNGKLLRTLEKPDSGYGRYMATSSDGMRLLYDILTRHVGFAQTVKEDLLLLPSMGFEVDGFVANGELVRVIDAGSGNTCFEWHTSGDLPISPDQHSAIDPSGHFVAIFGHQFINVFKLPDTRNCK